MNEERLLKLAKHLESGKLGHKEFDFRIIDRTCGSAGCALGELPFAFPDAWRLDTLEFSAYLIKDSEGDCFEDACIFFDLSSEEVDTLFIPGMDAPWLERVLYDEATRYDVADSIRKFVEWKKKRMVTK